MLAKASYMHISKYPQQCDRLGSIMILSCGDGKRINIAELSPSIKILEREEAVQNTLWEVYRKNSASHMVKLMVVQCNCHLLSQHPFLEWQKGNKKSDTTTRCHHPASYKSVSTPWLRIIMKGPSLPWPIAPKRYIQSIRWLSVTMLNERQTWSQSVFF